MSIVLVGSTSGSCTLQEQAVAGNTTLTLPTTSGTILTTGSSGQSIPKAALPTGSVLQVVQGTTNTEVSTTGTTYIDTGLSASITPTSSSSKILVLISHQGFTETDNVLWMKIVRGSTDILENKWTLELNSALVLMTTISLTYLDSPATTSSTTYKTMFKSRDSGEKVGVSRESAAPGTIILMEIAA